MKSPRLTRVLLVAALAATLVPAVALLIGCTQKGTETAVARKYTCVMHPQIIRDKPGDCPICGMKLVPIDPHRTPAPAAPVTKSVPGARRILLYRSPMNPAETSPMAKKDSMGMDFVPVYEDEVQGSPGGPEGLAPVTIDAAKRQLLGLKTVAVQRGPFETSIRTTGRVAADETRVHHVHTRFEAFVEHVTADFTGKYVKKGEALAYLYSPELYATQQEYLLALKASRSLGTSGVSSVAQGSQDLLAAARQRLILWEITPADIERIEKNGAPIRALPVYAPISGYVITLKAYHGMKVMPSDTLFEILDLSHVWVLADVYEYELPRLSLGQKATTTLSYWPGRVWNGTVTYIYPAVDEKTRTVKVRIELDNPKGELKPEMFADVTLRGRTRDVLQLPDDAILTSGTRNVVFVDLGEGRLLPREVILGDRGKGVVEVKSGLQAGDVVARGANFLVDSESRLKAAISAMGASR